MYSIRTWKVLIKYTGIGCITFLIACSSDKNENPSPSINFTEIRASGDITSQITAFRALLGDPVNTTPGQNAGRREINWDGVPDIQTNTDAFAGDFFNSTDESVAAGRKRGVVFITAGTGLRVSDNNFRDVASGYADEFKAFSPARTFAIIGSNKMDVIFKVPGTTNDAFVKGFGIVFSDVDQANSTTLEFFDQGISLGKFKAPVRSDENGFSFLGVVFPDSKVSKVTITSGSESINKKYVDSSENDLVVMDDFFYSEPLSLQ